MLVIELGRKSIAHQKNRFQKLLGLVELHSPQEGPNYANLEGAGTYELCSMQDRAPAVEPPAIWIVMHGRKICYAGDKVYDCSPGNAVVLFCPIGS